MILDKRCATVMYYYALFSLHGPGGYGTSSHETLTGYGGDLWRGPSEKIDRVQMVMVMCTYTVREVYNRVVNMKCERMWGRVQYVHALGFGIGVSGCRATLPV